MEASGGLASTGAGVKDEVQERLYRGSDLELSLKRGVFARPTDRPGNPCSYLEGCSLWRMHFWRKASFSSPQGKCGLHVSAVRTGLAQLSCSIKEQVLVWFLGIPQGQKQTPTWGHRKHSCGTASTSPSGSSGPGWNARVGEGTCQPGWIFRGCNHIGIRRLCSKELPGAGVGSTEHRSSRRLTGWPVRKGRSNSKLPPVPHKAFTIWPSTAWGSWCPTILYSSTIYGQTLLSTFQTGCTAASYLTPSESQVLVPALLELTSNPHREAERAETCSGATCAPHIQLPWTGVTFLCIIFWPWSVPITHMN